MKWHLNLYVPKRDKEFLQTIEKLAEEQERSLSWMVWHYCKIGLQDQKKGRRPERKGSE